MVSTGHIKSMAAGKYPIPHQPRPSSFHATCFVHPQSALLAQGTMQHELYIFGHEWSGQLPEAPSR